MVSITNKSLPVCFSISGNSIYSAGLDFVREGSLGADINWQLKSITFVEKVVNNKVFLIGDAVIWSPELKEPGEKVQVIMLKEEKQAGQFNTKTESPDDYHLKVYPNPFEQQVTITFSLPRESQVSLYITNESGQMVKMIYNNLKLPGADYSETIDGFYSTGIYNVALKIKNAIYSVKIIKNN